LFGTFVGGCLLALLVFQWLLMVCEFGGVLLIFVYFHGLFIGVARFWTAIRSAWFFNVFFFMNFGICWWIAVACVCFFQCLCADFRWFCWLLLMRFVFQLLSFLPVIDFVKFVGAFFVDVVCFSSVVCWCSLIFLDCWWVCLFFKRFVFFQFFVKSLMDFCWRCLFVTVCLLSFLDFDALLLILFVFQWFVFWFW